MGYRRADTRNESHGGYLRKEIQEEEEESERKTKKKKKEEDVEEEPIEFSDDAMEVEDNNDDRGFRTEDEESSQSKMNSLHLPTRKKTKSRLSPSPRVAEDQEKK